MLIAISFGGWDGRVFIFKVEAVQVVKLGIRVLAVLQLGCADVNEKTVGRVVTGDVNMGAIGGQNDKVLGVGRRSFMAAIFSICPATCDKSSDIVFTLEQV